MNDRLKMYFNAIAAVAIRKMLKDEKIDEIKLYTELWDSMNDTEKNEHLDLFMNMDKSKVSPLIREVIESYERLELMHKNRKMDKVTRYGLALDKSIADDVNPLHRGILAETKKIWDGMTNDEKMEYIEKRERFVKDMMIDALDKHSAYVKEMDAEKARMEKYKLDPKNPDNWDKASKDLGFDLNEFHREQMEERKNG